MSFSFLMSAFRSPPEAVFPYRKGDLFQIDNPQWFQYLELPYTQYDIAPDEAAKDLNPEVVIRMSVGTVQMSQGDLLELKGYNPETDKMTLAPLGAAFHKDVIEIPFNQGSGLEGFDLKRYQPKHGLILGL